MKKTITTREQILVDGIVKERTATHIVSGAHGWETLCAQGYNVKLNEHGEKTVDATQITRNQLPVTCHTCWIIWNDVNSFTQADFCQPEHAAVYSYTTLKSVDLSRTECQEPTMQEEKNEGSKVKTITRVYTGRKLNR